MTLNVKALAFAGAVSVGGVFLLAGLGNLLWASYGTALLDVGASIYPGYNGPDGFASVVVVTLYAALDGAIGGALLAWLYNLMAKKVGERAPRMTA
ncbi:MAG: hypothetical protein OER90_06240 [Gemmatimonadota bacterium]|nr:hypothetical protein [Gemmatimonadota bacterium]